MASYFDDVHNREERWIGMLMEMSVRQFLEELASSSPAPGGGSVSALAGALAAALVGMVGRLTGGGQPLEQVTAAVDELRRSLDDHVDRDTEAFNRVMAAYRLPRGTEEERVRRSQAIQTALQGAAEHPLAVAREALQVLEYCREAVNRGNPNALSDAAVAALMAYGGVIGALLNVAINLEGIKDRTAVETLAAEKERILTRARELLAEIRTLVNGKLGSQVLW